MYNNSYATQQYSGLDLQSKTESASPHELIMMLLSGALVRINAAIGHMERKETAKKAELIGKAIAIIDGLRTSLDMEQGGDIANNLDDLYLYMNRQLLIANSDDRIENLREVHSLLLEIKGAWDSIGNNDINDRQQRAAVSGSQQPASVR